MKKMVFQAMRLILAFALVISFIGCGLVISAIQGDDNDGYVPGGYEDGGDNGTAPPGEPIAPPPDSEITLTKGSWTTSSITSKTETKTFAIPAASSSRTVHVHWVDWNRYTPYGDIKVQLGSGSTYDDTPLSGFNGISCSSASYSLAAGETGMITVSWAGSYSGRNNKTGTFWIGYD
jgi:hypothetical protein